MFFFFNDTATTEIYTLSLHDALPISPTPAAPRWPASRRPGRAWPRPCSRRRTTTCCASTARSRSHCAASRSEEHTSELQSRQYLVCRLLLEKKKNNNNISLDVNFNTL